MFHMKMSLFLFELHDFYKLCTCNNNKKNKFSPVKKYFIQLNCQTCRLKIEYLLKTLKIIFKNVRFASKFEY